MIIWKQVRIHMQNSRRLGSSFFFPDKLILHRTNFLPQNIELKFNFFQYGDDFLYSFRFWFALGAAKFWLNLK